MPLSSTSWTTVRDSVTAPEACPSLVRTATRSTSAGFLVAHQDRRAIAAGHFEDRRDDRIEQRFDAGGARQDLRHLVQRRQILLRRFEQVRLVLALVDVRQELELVGIDGALHQRVAARFDDAERGGAVAASGVVAALESISSSTVEPIRSLSPLVSSTLVMRFSLTKVPLADCRSATTQARPRGRRSCSAAATRPRRPPRRRSL